ncbi:MAG: hypothetical protein GTO63_15730 [Anaerolineae bacterium]|nr:hypothetical protein [Anaerolineae bacterium]NIN96279.1 hypothetical protein [Anaerolineae bacterium]NIQ79299.1 hypothetical protein [Anaerolineae bacterium]
MSNANQYLPDFKPQVMSYVLHNATPEEIILRWGGLQMTVPPVDVVGHRPALAEDGSPIPGTFVIRDTYTSKPGGGIPRKGDPPNWFAATAIRNILKIDPETGEAVGPDARKGISVLPASPTPSMIQDAMMSGKARYEDFLVSWATDIVNGYQVARDRNQQAGYAPPPPGSEYQKAVLILEKSHAKMKKDLGMVGSLEQVDEELDDDFETFALAEAMAKAKRAAAAVPDVDPSELAAKLLENPEVRQKLKKKYRIRKVGHMPDDKVS